MNREEIEQRLDEKFDWEIDEITRKKVKSFFLDEILPEVLKDIIPFETNQIIVDKIRKQAKEKYNITL